MRERLTALTVTVGLALSGCGGDDEKPKEPILSEDQIVLQQASKLDKITDYHERDKAELELAGWLLLVRVLVAREDVLIVDALSGSEVAGA